MIKSFMEEEITITHGPDVPDTSNPLLPLSPLSLLSLFSNQSSHFQTPRKRCMLIDAFPSPL